MSYRILFALPVLAALSACSEPEPPPAPEPPATAAAPAATESAEEALGEVVDEINPLLMTSPLPYGMPPFDRIRDEHFLPAFEFGMAEHLEEVDAIASNPDAPSFDNTIVAMERAGQTLGNVQRVFFNLVGTHTNENLQAVQREVAPQLAAHGDAIVLNEQLFARIVAIYEQREELDLDPESLRLVERYHRQFVRAGARLSDEDKERLREINGELARLGTSSARKCWPRSMIRPWCSTTVPCSMA